MANYDEIVRFAQGGDDGNDTPGSIQPITGGEFVEETALQRSPENIRKRLEIIRAAIENLNYLSDYDRQLILRCEWAFTLSEPSPGNYLLAAAGGGDLTVYPALTPGVLSGGRLVGGRAFVNGLPYFGTIGVNELTLICDRDFTGQRGYADGKNFTTEPNALSLGANGVEVELVAEARPGGLATIIVEFNGNPKRKIKIKYGTAAPATTLDNIIQKVNLDLTSQGTYGLANFFRASTTVLNPTLVTPTPGFGVVQGGYDAEAHRVTLGQWTGFFSIVDNYLKEAEGIALGYPAGPVQNYVPPFPRGGRRQAIFDLPTDRIGGWTDNSSPTIGYALFNTGREPEKIPGAIPIGKMVNGKFVFIDGTLLGVGQTVNIGGNAGLIAALASIVGPTGASLIGYGGSPPWHPFGGGALGAGDLETVLDNLVLTLASANGASKLGTLAITGTASLNNVVQNLAPTLSIQQALMALLQDGLGVNGRVHESGHYLQTVNPIQKRLDALASAGGRRFQAIHKETDTLADNSATRMEYADLILQPVQKLGVLNLNEPVIAGIGVSDMNMSAGDIAARFPNIWPIFTYSNVYPESNALQLSAPPLIFVEIKSLIAGPSGDGPGLYIFDQFINLGLRSFRLRKLDNSYPDFTGAVFTAATVTFMHGLNFGTSETNAKMHLFNANDPNGGASIVMLGRHPDTVLMETYYNDAAVFPGAMKKGMVFRGDRIVFTPLVGNPKSSDDILTNADYSLLRGVETGTPLNASINHHHGMALNGYSNGTGFLGVITTPNAAGVITYNIGAPPATRKFASAVIYITGDVKALAGGNCRFQVELRRNGGINIAGEVIEFTALAPAETRKFRLQAIVPLAGVGFNEFELEKIGLSNVDPTTIINVYLAGSFIGYA